jgi:hypothetical protein
MNIIIVFIAIFLFIVIDNLTALAPYQQLLKALVAVCAVIALLYKCLPLLH